MKRTLVIRADAGTRIGTGHVMRCLALAQAWQDSGGRAVFAMAMETPALVDRLISEGMEVFHLSTEPGSLDDAEQTADLAQSMGSDWVVMDGYHFGSGYQTAIKEFGLRLLFIDDYGHADHYCADIILNQNLHAHEDLYIKKEPYTQLLLGLSYTLIRREFLKLRKIKRCVPEIARNVLITTGGSDPDNMTLKLIQALKYVNFDGLKFIVVVGGSNPYYNELRFAAQDLNFPIYLKNDVRNMATLMARAEVAISSGGSSIWELALMGVPVLGLARAKQEYQLLKEASQYGIAISLGYFKNVDIVTIGEAFICLAKDRELRSNMIRLGQSNIDGLGANRVLNSMEYG
jgi:UDP-2,4-diacetamido-2,4,6-trideoxy-beta-L-altropyranose hydrolase